MIALSFRRARTSSGMANFAFDLAFVDRVELDGKKLLFRQSVSPPYMVTTSWRSPFSILSSL